MKRIGYALLAGLVNLSTLVSGIADAQLPVNMPKNDIYTRYSVKVLGLIGLDREVYGKLEHLHDSGEIIRITGRSNIHLGPNSWSFVETDSTGVPIRIDYINLKGDRELLKQEHFDLIRRYGIIVDGIKGMLSEEFLYDQGQTRSYTEPFETDLSPHSRDFFTQYLYVLSELEKDPTPRRIPLSVHFKKDETEVMVDVTMEDGVIVLEAGLEYTKEKAYKKVRIFLDADFPNIKAPKKIEIHTKSWPITKITLERQEYYEVANR
jgi:hypothetical protein